MKNYYISKRDTLMKYCGLCKGAHYLDLDNGEVVMCAEFKLPDYQDAFEKETGVMAFPHLVAPTQVIGFSIASKAEKYGLDKQHRTFEAAMLLKQHHRGFDPRFSF